MARCARWHAIGRAPWWVAPETLRRIVGLGRDAIAEHETSCLRLIAVDGSSLPQELAMSAMRSFGGVLYGLYGPSMVKLNGRWVNFDEGRTPRRAALVSPVHGGHRALARHRARRPS